MDTTGLVLELLKQRGTITPLEQDILDTYHELSKNPFDRDSAIRQVQKNNINNPDILISISASPTTVYKPWEVASDKDVYSNLMSQLGLLAEKEREVLQGGK